MNVDIRNTALDADSILALQEELDELHRKHYEVARKIPYHSDLEKRREIQGMRGDVWNEILAIRDQIKNPGDIQPDDVVDIPPPPGFSLEQGKEAVRGFYYYGGKLVAKVVTVPFQAGQLLCNGLRVQRSHWRYRVDSYDSRVPSTDPRFYRGNHALEYIERRLGILD